jgi:hypothetical protein
MSEDGQVVDQQPPFARSCDEPSQSGWCRIADHAPKQTTRFGRYTTVVSVSAGSGVGSLELQRRCPETPVLFISGTAIEGWREPDIRNFEILPVGQGGFSAEAFSGVRTRKENRSAPKQRTRC